MVIKGREDQNEEERRQSKGKGKDTSSKGRSSKGKAVATEHSDSENEEARAPRKKDSRKDKSKSTEEPSVHRFSIAEIKAKLSQLEKDRKLTFVATRYPDPTFLTEAGLLDDVEAIFDSMGLAKFMSLPSDTYVDMTKEFLITLRARENKPRDYEWDDVGYIEFAANRKHYKVTYEELSEIYGLPRGLHTVMAKSFTEPILVWTTIGTGSYSKGLTKSANIRNPAIRYVHKALAHTFFARRETGTLREADMMLLMVGIAPFLGFLNEGRGISANRDDVSMVGMFVHFLLYIQEWIMVTPDKTPQISMGGLLTPLFRAKGIELTGRSLPVEWMDIHYLNRTHYLCGTLGPSYALKLQLSVKETKKFLLPNIPLTHISHETNVRFLHDEEVWYNKTRDGDLTRIEKAKGSTSVQAPRGLAPPDEDLPPPQDRVYGSSRYDFQPWDEPIPARQTALQAAHHHINLLQRYCKWQDRSFKKVVNQLRYVTKEVRELKAKLSGGGCSSSRREDVVDAVIDQRVDNEPQQVEPEAGDENIDESMNEEAMHRHSFHNVPDQTEEDQEPARASSFEPRQRRRKRRATRSPTPPAPASSNDSYSFGSDTWY